MVSEYKHVVGSLFKGKRIHAVCDCIIKLDVTGVVESFYVDSGEIIYLLNTGEKVIKLGENTPGLKIEIYF